jgi:N4-gp56 family major capsid protein
MGAFVGTSTSSANFDKTVQTIISKTLYDLLRSGLPHLPKGCVIPASFSQGTGQAPTFRFVNVPDLDATPAAHLLTEGVPPAGQELTWGYEEFTAVQRGDFVRLSDRSIFESPFQLASTAAERITRQMAAVIDTRAKQIWAAGTNYFCSGTGNNVARDVAAGDILVASDIKKAVALLEASGVKRLGGGGNTTGGYVGLLNPYVKYDLEMDDDAGGWMDANRYAGGQALFTGEVGSFAGVRFVVDKSVEVQAGAGTGSIDVYETTIIGANSIAFGDVGTNEVIVERGGVSDPLHQIQTVGWKCWLDGMLVGEGANSTNVGSPRYVKILSAASL